MTREEREALIFMIALHGFELYERWWPDSGTWTPTLVGRQIGENEFECVPTMQDGRIFGHMTMTLRTRHERLAWCKLTDAQLQAFHNTVVSTATN